MKTQSKLALAVVLLAVAVDAMAQGGPPRAVWLVPFSLGGGLGFLAGWLWCKRCHAKKRSEGMESPNDK